MTVLDAACGIGTQSIGLAQLGGVGERLGLTRLGAQIDSVTKAFLK